MCSLEPLLSASLHTDINTNRSCAHKMKHDRKENWTLCLLKIVLPLIALLSSFHPIRACSCVSIFDRLSTTSFFEEFVFQSIFLSLRVDQKYHHLHHQSGHFFNMFTHRHRMNMIDGIMMSIITLKRTTVPQFVWYDEINIGGSGAHPHWMNSYLSILFLGLQLLWMKWIHSNSLFLSLSHTHTHVPYCCDQSLLFL